MLDPWDWVMQWVDLVPVNCLASLLVTVFPKWLPVFLDWLNSNPNFDEVANWYTWWKSKFPKEFVMNAIIQESFHKALQLMNGAVTGEHGHLGAQQNIVQLMAEDLCKRPSSIEASRGMAVAQVTVP